MFQRTLKPVALLISLTWLLFSACAPSTEGETKKWTKNQETVTEHSATWPGFKTVLEADQKKAKGMWEEAGKLSDEKQKAEKMKETNTYQLELLNKLGEVKAKNDTIDTTAKKLNKLKLKGLKHTKRNKVVKEMYEVKSKVASNMSGAAPKDKEEAMTLLKAQTSLLAGAWRKGSSAYKSLDTRKKKKKLKKDKKKKK